MTPVVVADEVAVLRALRGEHVDRLNFAERPVAIALLTRRGHSAPEIARRIGVSARTVERHRARARQEHAA